jgi:hypothetical protein
VTIIPFNILKTKTQSGGGDLPRDASEVLAVGLTSYSCHQGTLLHLSKEGAELRH